MAKSNTSFKKGHKVPQNWRDKISKFSKKPERIKISIKNLGKCGLKGWHHSEENKRRKSEANKGKIRTLEMRKKVSKGLIKYYDKIGRKTYKRQVGTEHRLWRRAVLEKDSFVCQKCFQLGGNLIAHHIFNFADYLELRFAIDNGITFCKKCHREFHRKYGKKNNTKEQLIEFLGI